MKSDEEFAEHYRMLEEPRLLELAQASDDLVEPAKTALRAEFERHGLPWPLTKTKSAAEIYGEMSNHGLLRAAAGYEKLGEAEQASLRDEFASRGLEQPMVAPENSEGERDAVGLTKEAPDAGDWTTIRSYRDLPDALVAKSLLEGAEIPW